MVRIAARDRVILELSEALREGDMLRLADLLIAKEQYLVGEQRFVDRAEQVVVRDRLGEVHAVQFRTDVRGELLDLHAVTKIDEPVVLPASRSRCAWTASSSS